MGLNILKKNQTRIVICINSLVATRYLAYSNHIQTFFQLGRQYPKIDFVIFNPERMSIDRARNEAAQVAMRVGAKYLLFIDDDVLIPHAGKGERGFLQKLIDVDADIVAGDVCIRGYPFNHMLFRYVKGRKDALLPMAKLPAERGVIDVDAVGFSLCLIKTELLLRMHAPYFITGVTNTEDIYFCLKAKAQFPKLTIKAETSIQCMHILWDECIGSPNKAAYKRYYEIQNPELRKAKKHDDRGMKYAIMIRGAFDEA